ncbi:MAG: adenylate kinase [Sedimentisphaerales bacterium]|nr:adenylate kinase [Sedimentisphaerales bacterium]
MNVIFLGPPGAGKGTQCKVIADRYQLRHLSSGDILRRERADNTDLGQKAQSFMDSGRLVPDDLIVAMMMKEINAADTNSGVVLDGFPRTIGQAEELDKALNAAGKDIDVVLCLDVDDDKLEHRITGRRSCSGCGAAYHITFNPPQVDGICDKCQKELTQRSDDTAEVVKNRIKTYHDQTAPLVSFYKEKGNLKNVDGNVAIEQVTQAMCDILDRVST